MDINRMTDYDILDEASRAVSGYLDAIRPNRDFSRQGCVDFVSKRLLQLFRYSRSIMFFAPLTEAEIQEFNALIDPLMPSILERVLTVETEYRKERMEMEINKAKAGAIIVPAFNRAGFTVRVDYMQNAAFVHVHLAGSDWTQFMVRYADIRGEDSLDGMVAMAVDLKGMIERKKKK
jgi:hypothetical protein